MRDEGMWLALWGGVYLRCWTLILRRGRCVLVFVTNNE